MFTDADDPVQRVIDAETALDHARAKARGLRVKELTNLVVGALDGHGVLRDQSLARVIVWSALADALYRDAAIDITTGP